MTLTAPGNCSHQVDALIDSGYSITRITTEVCNQLSLKHNSAIDSTSVCSATGSNFDISGIATLHFLIQEIKWSTKAFVVTNSVHPVILGLNFLQHSGTVIYLKTNHITMGQHDFPIHVHQTNTDSVWYDGPT